MAEYKQDQYDKEGGVIQVESNPPDVQQGVVSDNPDHLQRRLGNRQIQLIAIGGSIGTALFVSVGSALRHGGPGSLILAYTIYSCFLGLVNNCMAEMAVLQPVSGGFVRMAGKWVSSISKPSAGFHSTLLLTIGLVVID